MTFPVSRRSLSSSSFSLSSLSSHFRTSSMSTGATATVILTKVENASSDFDTKSIRLRAGRREALGKEGGPAMTMTTQENGMFPPCAKGGSRGIAENHAYIYCDDSRNVFIEDNGKHYPTLVFRGVPKRSEEDFEPIAYDTVGMKREETLLLLRNETAQLYSGDIIVSLRCSFKSN
ncbi:hypothetical protein CONPUDRAFT_82967 [Coniophora puteana RWD-64-598 SS2]|uniref:Uncharacterized protein n=1 Tax=Coniophora puteana (strain RWD-64-598) TaxID=741705 RepID=A0A5M3MLB7_CONPW|nr:uncharacterized protein CONPUDRAFT_82967 [Coniophora puteana RWD-64-598 SS2]EIW79594.1 hypothetical protein CONPUDRAFT_82967 [Coniophora puteana RWD-64-598 SS2]